MLAGVGKTMEAILAGSAEAVSAAWNARAPMRRAGFDIIGAIVVGPGDVSLPVLARTPLWDALEIGATAAHALVLADPPEEGGVKRAILARAAEAGMKVYIATDAAPRRLRLEDLIGRPLRAVDWARIGAAIEGKRVMITGGGGSIGAELARRIAGLAPARLTLLDHSEHNLYRIGLELPDAATILADIRDERAMRRWIAQAAPDLIFHAAALKQVPVVEAFPCEGVQANVCGLRHVAEAAQDVGANLIFVSTDKAVEPSGVMGASKRLGELYCQALDRRGGQRAIPVRLGNVLGSSGSVAPVFEAQLAQGGALTVTDPQVTRFFMSIPQAADALLHAAATGLGGAERGAALTIDMGEALPVVELAREVIRLEGLRPEIDAPIVFTGLRPGEKLHEALIGAEEWRQADPAPGVIAAASAPRPLNELHTRMRRLAELARDGQADAVKRELFAAIGAACETRALAV